MNFFGVEAMTDASESFLSHSDCYCSRFGDWESGDERPTDIATQKAQDVMGFLIGLRERSGSDAIWLLSNFEMQFTLSDYCYCGQSRSMTPIGVKRSSAQVEPGSHIGCVPSVYTPYTDLLGDHIPPCTWRHERVASSKLTGIARRMLRGWSYKALAQILSR